MTNAHSMPPPARDDARRMSVEYQRHSGATCLDAAARLKENPISQPGHFVPAYRYPSIALLDCQSGRGVTGRIGLPVAARERDQQRKNHNAEHRLAHLKIPFSV